MLTNIAHHINLDESDNRPENLVNLGGVAEHNRLHTSLIRFTRIIEDEIIVTTSIGRTTHPKRIIQRFLRKQLSKLLIDMEIIRFDKKTKMYGFI